MEIKPDKAFKNFSKLSDEDFYKLVSIIKKITAEELNIPESEILPLTELSFNNRRSIIDRICIELRFPYIYKIEGINNVLKLVNLLGTTATTYLENLESKKHLDKILKAYNIKFDFSKHEELDIDDDDDDDENTWEIIDDDDKNIWEMVKNSLDWSNTKYTKWEIVMNWGCLAIGVIIAIAFVWSLLFDTKNTLICIGLCIGLFIGEVILFWIFDNIKTACLISLVVLVAFIAIYIVLKFSFNFDLFTDGLGL